MSLCAQGSCPYNYTSKRSCLLIPLVSQSKHCPLSESEKPRCPTGKPRYIFTTPTETTSRSYIQKLHFKCTPQQSIQPKLICLYQTGGRQHRSGHIRSDKINNVHNPQKEVKPRIMTNMRKKNLPYPWLFHFLQCKLQ